VTNAVKKILTQIDALPEEDQRWLTEVLVVRRRDADAGVELSDEWRVEILRRVEQVERGEVKPEPWSEVRKRIRQALDENA
jgi:putative addiction module component (TIGR02574 family)